MKKQASDHKINEPFDLLMIDQVLSLLSPKDEPVHLTFHTWTLSPLINLLISFVYVQKQLVYL